MYIFFLIFLLKRNIKKDFYSLIIIFLIILFVILNISKRINYNKINFFFETVKIILFNSSDYYTEYNWI